MQNPDARVCTTVRSTSVCNACLVLLNDTAEIKARVSSLSLSLCVGFLATMDGPAAPLPSLSCARTLADLDADAMAHCTSFLGVRDVASLALTCKSLRSAAYSDAVWSRLFSARWPHQSLASGAFGIREEYLARRTALLQLKFDDPLGIYFSTKPVPHSHLLLNKDDIILAQGSSVQKLRLDTTKAEMMAFETLTAHSARITCMRLFPLVDTSLFRNDMGSEHDFLATSSSDRTVRLWWKGRSYRSFKGHNSPVTTLADRLLGDFGSKVLASGGEDCTVRLWSVSSSMKQHPLLVTYHGHEKPVSLLSVARHKSSLLVSVSKDSRVRVWDATSSSSSGSSSCVGMASVFGPPVGIKCHDTLCFLASGSSVVAIDLRTMKKVLTVAIHSPRITSFDMLPSKGLICTGGEHKAMLWDIRVSHEKPVPVANLDAQTGGVTLLHMDPYKVVTGGPLDYRVHVYEVNTGHLANSLDCRMPGETEIIVGLSAMAVDGCRLITSGCTEEPGIIYYRDYSNCSAPVSSYECNSGSKFWEEPQQYSDG